MNINVLLSSTEFIKRNAWVQSQFHLKMGLCVYISYKFLFFIYCCYLMVIDSQFDYNNPSISLNIYSNNNIVNNVVTPFSLKTL